MKKYKVGFAGTGHMGTILAEIVKKNISGENMIVSCSNEANSKKKAEALGCEYGDTATVISESEVVFLGIRPQNLDELAERNKAEIEAFDGIWISMLAGVSLERLEKCLGKNKKIIRIMPNTPSELGEGIIAYTLNQEEDEADGKFLETILSGAGLIEKTKEQDIDIISVIAGCGPAYAYLFADSLAKAGEKFGLDKERAKNYAAQMLLGSAKMILKTGKDPEELKNQVCSPGGTTIEGVKVLEAGELGKLTEAAVRASFEKTKAL